MDESIHSQRSPRFKKRSLLNELTFCAYCGEEGTNQVGPDNELWHVDHVVPKSKRGSDKAINLVRSCRRCNIDKGVKIWRPQEGTINADGIEYDENAAFDALWQGIENLESMINLFCDREIEKIKMIRKMAPSIADDAKIEALKANGFGDTK